MVSCSCPGLGVSPSGWGSETGFFRTIYIHTNKIIQMRTRRITAKAVCVAEYDAPVISVILNVMFLLVNGYTGIGAVG